MSLINPITKLTYNAGKIVLKGIDKIDRKLMYISMDLMAKRAGSPGPIHPKNFLKLLDENQAWFKDYLPKQGGRVLDLGAGSGSASFLAAKKGAYVTALEQNPNNIKLIENLKQKLENPKLIEVKAHNLEKTPYPVHSSQYDLVLCNDLIEHLYNRQECLKECARALKPEGILVITGPNRLTTYKLIRGQFGLPTFADDDHKIEYTRDEFIHELKEAGFFDIMYESTIVIDAPINGAIDMLGPISMALYASGSKLKHKLAQWLPNESTGFQMVFKKGELSNGSSTVNKAP